MSIIRNLHVALVISFPCVGLLVPNGFAHAQRSTAPAKANWADSTPEKIMSLTRKSFPTGILLEVLRQRHRSYPAATRRELGDSLVALAVRQPEAADDPIFVIAFSGSSRVVGGTADPEALDRLIEIARRAAGAETRKVAIAQSLEQINPSRAFPFLRQAATSANVDDAFAAVSGLVTFAFGTNTRGLSSADREAAGAMLQELFTKGLVKTGPASNILCRTAVNQNWPGSSRCRRTM